MKIVLDIDVPVNVNVDACHNQKRRYCRWDYKNTYFESIRPRRWMANAYASLIRCNTMFMWEKHLTVSK